VIGRDGKFSASAEVTIASAAAAAMISLFIACSHQVLLCARGKSSAHSEA